MQKAQAEACYVPVFNNEAPGDVRCAFLLSEQSGTSRSLLLNEPCVIGALGRQVQLGWDVFISCLKPSSGCALVRTLISMDTSYEEAVQTVVSLGDKHNSDPTA